MPTPTSSSPSKFTANDARPDVGRLPGPNGWGDVFTLLFRTSTYEDDVRFRDALATVACVGLQWAGVVGLIGVGLYALVNVGVLGYEIVWTYAGMGGGGHIAVPTLVGVTVASGALLIASKMACSLQVSRFFMAAAALVAGAFVVYDGALGSGDITDYIAIIYLIGVAAVPFRPWQTLLMGLGLMGVVSTLGMPNALLGSMSGHLDAVFSQLAFVGITTVLLTGVSTILYQRHWARVRAQAALERSQQMMEQTETIAQVGGWSVDVRTDEISWTPELYNIFGVEPGFDIRFESALRFFSGEARERMETVMKQCASDGEAYDVELPMETADGRSRWVRVRGEADTEEGEVVQIFGALQDVTERRRAQEQLRERERLLRSITENVSDGIYRSTPDGDFVYANQAFADMFGYDRPEDLQGVDPADLYADSESRKALTDRLHEEGAVRGAEIRCVRRDGTTFPARLTTTVTHDGDSLYFDGVITDVTERKQYEQRLKAAKEEAEASREEAETQHRRAQEASRSKSRFLAGVAHDLKSPLSSVMGFARVLADRLDGEAAKQAASIQRGAEQIRDMAEALMELARLEAGSLNLPAAPTEVGEVLEGVVATLEAQADEAEIDLRLDRPDATVWAQANASSLRRALNNLATNAITYSDPGSQVTLSVDRRTNGEDETETVVVTVEDTGPGIDPDFQDRLFEPFARDAPDTEGTGLGLAVTKELVEAMGGTVDVESEPGEGTCFRIRLAAAQAPDEEATEVEVSDEPVS